MALRAACKPLWQRYLNKSCFGRFEWLISAVFGPAHAVFLRPRSKSLLAGLPLGLCAGQNGSGSVAIIYGKIHVPKMVEDRPLLGIALMLGFCLLAPLGDSVAKLLGGVVSIGHLVAVRFVAQTLILVPLVLYFSGGKGLILRGRLFWLAVLRTVLHISGISVMFVALQHLPVADAVAIAFVLPFMMLFLG